MKVESKLEGKQTKAKATNVKKQEDIEKEFDEENDYKFVSEEEYAKREKRLDKILKKDNTKEVHKMGTDKK